MKIEIASTKQTSGPERQARERRRSAPRSPVEARARSSSLRAQAVRDAGRALVAEAGIDWSKVVAFHLDEYVGLPVTHPASFRRYLAERFVARVPSLGEFVPIDAGADDLEAELRRLNRLMRGRTIELCRWDRRKLPPRLQRPARRLRGRGALHPRRPRRACRRQQLGEGWFSSLDAVPRRAISMSVRQMLKSERIILCVPDARKRAPSGLRSRARSRPTNPPRRCSATKTAFSISTHPPLPLCRVNRSFEDRHALDGLFDLQVNGFAGVDFNAEAIDPDQVDHALEAMLETGVTACLRL